MSRKITFACSVLNYGGVGKILAFVTSSLLSEGWQVDVLSLRNEKRPVFLPEGASFASIEEIEATNRVSWRLKLISKIRKEIKKGGVKTICTFGSEPSVMVRLATLCMKHITVISAERSDPYTLPKMWQKLSSWAYSHSDYCVFQLEKQRDFHSDRVKKKSFVIPNAFIPKGEPVEAIKEKRKVIVSAGRFVHQKGYDTLIRAFAKVSKMHPDYTLELYGGGEEKELYEQIIREEGIEGKVKLFDYVKDVESVIAGCSAFVLSSRFEGIPNVLIEAMSVGVPAVATDCTPGGPAFLTDNGKRGLLVPVDDVDAMADAICKILESPKLSEQLSEAGKEICSLLEEKSIAKQWVDMFTQIISDKQ